MLDDFIIRALLAGIGIAIVAGPLGCFIVWRRMAYFGDTMAHSALLGVALALLLDISLTAGVFAVAVVVALALVALQNRNALPADTLLGILSHGTLALGIVTVASMSWVRVDLTSFLFGDILSVSRIDIAVIYATGTAILAVLYVIWRPLLAATLSAELAQAEGLSPQRTKLAFMLLMACMIAIAMKIVGILLITSLLIIPAATARRYAGTPEQMAILASVAGILAVGAGIAGSLGFDTPSGPSIVVAALLLFLLGLVPMPFRKSLKSNLVGDQK